MSPVEYERQLAGVSKENRRKMKIYMVKLNKNKPEDTQLNLFESL